MLELQEAKKLILDYFKEMENCSVDEVESVLSKYQVADCPWEGSYPFMFQYGPKNIGETFWKPLKKSLKYMQRRMDIFMAGEAIDGNIWVASMGQFMGLYDEEFLNIRVTGKMQNLWYSEFNRVENGKIVDSALFVDLIGFMKEAGCYPLPPETGHFYCYPGPRDHNGLLFGEYPNDTVQRNFAVCDGMSNMNQALSRSGSFDTVPVDQMRKVWADDMIWYGPCGVGASLTIPRYLKQHSGPFRKHLDKKHPLTEDANYASENDRESFAKRCSIENRSNSSELQNVAEFASTILTGTYGRKSRFAEGDFLCSYSNQKVSPIGGWLGMTGGAEDIPLHADLNFYYIKDGKISENWCYFDIPYFLKCQGLDIFERTASIINPY